MTMTDQRSPQSAENTGDLDTVVAALHDRSGPLPITTVSNSCERSARSNRRAGLGLALLALIVGAVFQLATATPRFDDQPSGDSRAGVVFSNAQTGTCLSWPSGSPDKPSFVQCRDDHMFEVATSVEMTNFGEPCQAAVRQYLGRRYDPNSRFTISVLWAGDAAADGAGGRNLLCGLELLGADGKPVPFKGQVAALDQSKVWPPGTCLGLDAGTRRSTELPVDCASEHAVEVTGSVNLSDRFGAATPTAQEQEPLLRDECTRITEAYVAPAPLQTTGLVLNYGTIAPASWDAGSHQVSCGLVSPSDQGLNPLVGSVRSTPGGDAAPQAPQPPPAAPPPPPPPAPEPTRTPEPTRAPETTSSAAPQPRSTTPSSTSAPAPSSTTAPAASSTPPSTSSPALGPPPGPATEPSESAAPQPGVIEIPGMAPFTLPGFESPPPAQAG